ncbi:hypothetical protein K435DRAFT_774642 [Dendrothele bispora CBS 962.96]|uniref:Uncharacterized protein n=1 Tax=Dendrothele bispora (strain CBS 962.96) TaxID=1314807 RepID=A0A4S8MNY6_DENBC|nr:hypothetical protein K435DRAFT_774642 [Dendrothele bispora CBS 962.96]
MGNSKSTLKNAEALANKLSTQNTELVTQVSSLRDTVAQLSASMATIQAKLDRMEKTGTQASAPAPVSFDTSQIEAKLDKMQAMEAQISAMNDTVSSLKVTVPADMKTRLDKLQKLDQMEAKITQLTNAPAPQAPSPAPASNSAAVTVDPDILKTVKRMHEIDMARLHNYHRSHKIQWPPSLVAPAELKGDLPKTEREVINLSADQINALATALGLPDLPEDESERGSTDRHLQVLYYIGVYYHH